LGTSGPGSGAGGGEAGGVVGASGGVAGPGGCSGPGGCGTSATIGMPCCSPTGSSGKRGGKQGLRKSRRGDSNPGPPPPRTRTFRTTSSVVILSRRATSGASLFVEPSASPTSMRAAVAGTTFRPPRSYTTLRDATERKNSRPSHSLLVHGRSGSGVGRCARSRGGTVRSRGRPSCCRAVGSGVQWLCRVSWC
jgi:hypothetical protein